MSEGVTEARSKVWSEERLEIRRIRAISPGLIYTSPDNRAELGITAEREGKRSLERERG